MAPGTSPVARGAIRLAGIVPHHGGIAPTVLRKYHRPDYDNPRTGSFTRPVPARADDTVHVDYGPLGAIACRFA